MKNILIVTAVANDVFISNFSIWLKRMTAAEIDIMYFYDVQEQVCDQSAYHEKFLIQAKVKVHNRFKANLHLKKMMLDVLKGRHYDIIQCHGALGNTIVVPELKKYCDKLCLTFWGGEDRTQTCYGHHSLYNFFLPRFLKKIDWLINSEEFDKQMLQKYPQLKGKTKVAYLGSAPLDRLYQLMENESKKISKEKLSIDSSKTTVLIGYSGKEIHHHADIIHALENHAELKDKLHILAPMTRGAKASYVDEIEILLKNSGFSYTLLRDRFLTDEEISRLRNATDIVLQMSEYDGFSRSLIECMCAHAIMIYGEWLEYEGQLENNGLQAIRVAGIDIAVNMLPEIIAHPEKYEAMKESNNLNGKRRNSWSECIKDWVKIYDGR